MMPPTLSLLSDLGEGRIHKLGHLHSARHLRRRCWSGRARTPTVRGAGVAVGPLQGDDVWTFGHGNGGIAIRAIGATQGVLIGFRGYPGNRRRKRYLLAAIAGDKAGLDPLRELRGIAGGTNEPDYFLPTPATIGCVDLERLVDSRRRAGN